MPTSVRLDPETELLLRRLARQGGRSKSEVIRDALHRLAEESQAPVSTEGPYEFVSDLIGIAASGRASTRARDHKREYRERLRKKHRR